VAGHRGPIGASPRESFAFRPADAVRGRLSNRSRAVHTMRSEPSQTSGRDNPRREFIRHTIDVPLEVETLTSREARQEHSVNVSSGGLALVSSSCRGVGDLIRLRIPTVTPPFEAAARVAWCRSEEGNYLVGVEFVDAGSAFRSRMVQQVCSIENYRKEIREREGRSLSTQDAAAEWIERYAGRFPDSEVVRADSG